MVATPKSSLEVEDAIVRVGERLGMKSLLLRLIAAELPDNPWLLDLQVEREGPLTVATTTHLCGAACAGEPRGCLTAFKVEDAVTKRTGEDFILAGVETLGAARVRVTLRSLHTLPNTP